MNQPNDLDINRHIRKAFVKHWVDLGRLSIRTTKGRVTIRGHLERISGTQERLTSAIVDGMFKEIDRIEGLQNVSIDLANWINTDGKWQNIERGKNLSASGTRAGEASQSSYDIKQ